MIDVRPFIDLRELDVSGNILDIGFENCGIIYNVYKKNTRGSYFEVDYSDKNEGMSEVESHFYDFCVCFFSLKDIFFLKQKKDLIALISRSIKENGILYIWDINKTLGQCFKGSIKIMLPDRSIKKINIKDYNIFNDTSMGKTINILSEDFDILDTYSWDGIYFIKAQKKKSASKADA